MSFIKRGLKVLSFAEPSDVQARDQRIFEQNEGLTDDVIEANLIRATERILSKIKQTAWWKDQFPKPTPDVNATKIKARQNDFTDLCVYQALAEYTLPLVAEFDSEEESERSKMSYYQMKASSLFQELIESGDWYDFSNSGSIQTIDIKPGFAERRRIR